MTALVKCAIVTTCIAGLAGCQQASGAPTPRVSATPTPTRTPLAECPLRTAATGPQVLLQNLPAPDDLAFDNDGRLLFSDINAGTVSMLNADGSVERIAGGLASPEGIVVLGDGRILVAEQRRNRVVAIDPQSHVVSLWRAFPNRTGKDGIDGIGPILSSGEVVVPDSPNGVVWRVGPDGGTATQIAAGLARPAGAGVDASGRIFVADEGGAVWVLDPTRRRFATLPTPDDVLVGRGGRIFVNTLGDNAIHEFDAQGHQVGVVTGIQQPQGIALDGADNLYYTEFNTGRIDRVTRTFVLDPPNVTRTTAATFVICPVIRRAVGFNDPLRLSTGSSVGSSILRLVQPGTVSSGALEVRTTERAIVINVDTISGGVNLALSQTVALSP